MHFHNMTYMATPQHQNPCYRGHKIYNFSRPFLGQHYYILGLSNLCLGVERKIFKEMMHFKYKTYRATPQNKNPCPRGHEIYNFGKPFFFIITTQLVCLIYTWEQRRLFKEIQQVYTFYLKITSPLNLQFLVPLPYRCYLPTVVKIGPDVLEKKMLTHDARRRTPTHSNMLPE